MRALVLVALLADVAAAEPKEHGSVVLVLERPSSRRPLLVDAIKQGAIDVVEHLAPEDRVMIVEFDDTPTVLVPLQLVRDRRAIRHTIERLDVVDVADTDLYAPLNLAYDALLHVNRGPRHIVVVTGHTAQSSNLGELAAKMKKVEITASAIGYGRADRTELGRITASGGQLYMLDTATDVEKVLPDDVAGHL
jgi:hypothetical protein